MNAEELKDRSKRMALCIIALVERFPKNLTTDVVGRQLIRSACSVAANYRAACKARSRPDSLISSVWLKKRQTRSCFGWSYF